MGYFHGPSSHCCKMRGKQHHLLTVSLKDFLTGHISDRGPNPGAWYKMWKLWQEDCSPEDSTRFGLRKDHRPGTSTDLKASSMLPGFCSTRKCSWGCLRRKDIDDLIQPYVIINIITSLTRYIHWYSGGNADYGGSHQLCLNLKPTPKERIHALYYKHSREPIVEKFIVPRSEPNTIILLSVPSIKLSTQKLCFFFFCWK